MKKIIILCEILALIGVGYFLFKDAINFDMGQLDDNDYSLYVGRYENLILDGTDHEIEWINLNDDGTWKDHQSRVGFFDVEGTDLVFYQNFLGIILKRHSASYYNQTLTVGEIKYIIPEPFEAPQMIQRFDRWVYWSEVPFASAYEILINGHTYDIVSETHVLIDTIIEVYMEVTVKAIDEDNRDKDSVPSLPVTLYPMRYDETNSLEIDLSLYEDTMPVVISPEILSVRLFHSVDGTRNNFNLNIQNRTHDLRIILDDVRINNQLSSSTKPIIYYSGTTPFLTIIEAINGSSTLFARSGDDGENPSQSGADGSHTIALWDVYFTGDQKLTLYGGNGGDGADGRGGDLFSSGTDGGDGGNGNVAISAVSLYLDDPSLVDFRYGNPGLGGDGASGGLFAGDGDDGDDGETIGTLPDLILVETLFE